MSLYSNAHIFPDYYNTVYRKYRKPVVCELKNLKGRQYH